MNITITNERENENRAVEELTREAFWNLYVPGCDEHYLVNQMRNHPDFIEELDFVAKVDGVIVGSIMYTKSKLISDSCEEKEIVSFGPLCVHPDFQRKGIGSRLISHTFDLLKKRGVEGVVILGDPHNYVKHGFKNGKDLNIAASDGTFPYGLLAIELNEGAFTSAPTQWRYQYSDLYEIDESKVADFDSGFPPKEKEYRYSQELFSIGIRAVLK